MDKFERKAYRLYTAGAAAEDRRAAAEQIARLRRDVATLEGALRDLWEHPEFNQRLFRWVEDLI